MVAVRLLLAAASVALPEALGYGSYLDRVPNGRSVSRNGQLWPGVGHSSAGGGPSSKNPFGTDFAAAGHAWTAALCRLDSDGDGQSNGLELGDPNCEWSVSSSTPHSTLDISHPGYADSMTSRATSQSSTAAPSPTQQSSTAAPSPTQQSSTAAPSPMQQQRPTPSATSGIGSATDLPVAGAVAGLSLSFRAVGTSSAELSLRLERRAWLALGISAGSEVSMDSAGQGADVVACTDGDVRRYWVTGKQMQLNDYSQVPNATCTQVAGATILSFTRPIGAEGSRQRALSPGTLQQVTWAHGSDGEISIGYHGVKRGGVLVDFATGTSAEAHGHGSGATMYLHMAFMTFAWAGCLPLGALMARALRKVPGAREGAWFRWHVRIQGTGWLLQLLGLGFAIWHSHAHGLHFDSAHARVGVAVVAAGTLQPLNAALRPRPGQPKSCGRIAFEVVHKGSGWLAVSFGIVNVGLGIALASSSGHSHALQWTAVVLAALCLLLVAAFLALSALCPDNRLSRVFAGAEGAKVTSQSG